MVAVTESDAGVGPKGSEAIAFEPVNFRPGLIAEVYRTDAFGVLADTNLVRIGNYPVEGIYNDWGAGSVNGWGKDSLEIKYTGYFVPKVTGMYTFGLLADDDASLTLAGEALISSDLQEGTSHTETSAALPRLLEAGRMYPLKVHYMESTGGAEVALGYKIGDPSDAKVAAAAWQPVTPDLLFHYEPPHPGLATKETIEHVLEGYAKAEDLSRTAADVAAVRTDLYQSFATKGLEAAQGGALAEESQLGLKALILATDARVEAASKDLADHEQTTAAQLTDLSGRLDQARAEAVHPAPRLRPRAAAHARGRAQAKEVLEAADKGLAATLESKSKVAEVAAAKAEVLAATSGLSERVAGVKADLNSVEKSAAAAAKAAADEVKGLGGRVAAIEKGAIPALTDKLEAAVRGITNDAIPAVQAKLQTALQNEEAARTAADGAIQTSLSELSGSWRSASEALERSDAALREAVRSEQTERTAQDALIRGEFVARAEMQKAVAEVSKATETLRAEAATKSALEELKAATSAGLRTVQDGISRVETQTLPQAVAALQNKDAELSRGVEAQRTALDEQKAAADASYAPRAALAEAITGVEARIGDTIETVTASTEALASAVREINEAKLPGLAADTAAARTAAEKAVSDEAAARARGDELIGNNLTAVAREISSMRTGATDSFDSLKREDEAIKANVRASIESLTGQQKALADGVTARVDGLEEKTAATKAALDAAAAEAASDIATLRDASAAAAAATDARLGKLDARVDSVEYAAKSAAAKLADDMAATAAAVGTRVADVENKQAAWSQEAHAREAALQSAAEQERLALSGRVGVLEERAQAISGKVESHEAVLENTAASVSAAHEAARAARRAVDEKAAEVSRAIQAFSAKVAETEASVDAAKAELHGADRELEARLSGLESETRAKAVALEEADKSLLATSNALRSDVSSLGSALRNQFASFASKLPQAEADSDADLVDVGDAWGVEAGATGAGGACCCAADVEEAMYSEAEGELSEEPVF
eukprot:tig00020510_g9925.t1